MLKNEIVPILEFDEEVKAIIEPSMITKKIDISKHCVLTFFREVIETLLKSQKLSVRYRLKNEIGLLEVYEMDYQGSKVAVFHPVLGAPCAAGFLEELIALGCRKFVACGGAGVLVKEKDIGHLMVPYAAVRDEGTSYHYLPPSREVEATPEAVETILRLLRRKKIPHSKIKTWTTDAFYRETKNKVALRMAEGCVAVEMECAAFFAVAKFRGVKFGQILYAGDDLSGDNWNDRSWSSREEIRYNIFELALEACLNI